MTEIRRWVVDEAAPHDDVWLLILDRFPRSQDTLASKTAPLSDHPERTESDLASSQWGIWRHELTHWHIVAGAETSVRDSDDRSRTGDLGRELG